MQSFFTKSLIILFLFVLFTHCLNSSHTNDLKPVKKTSHVFAQKLKYNYEKEDDLTPYLNDFLKKIVVDADGTKLNGLECILNPFQKEDVKKIKNNNFKITVQAKKNYYEITKGTLFENLFVNKEIYLIEYKMTSLKDQKKTFSLVQILTREKVLRFLNGSFHFLTQNEYVTLFDLSVILWENMLIYECQGTNFDHFKTILTARLLENSAIFYRPQENTFPLQDDPPLQMLRIGSKSVLVPNPTTTPKPQDRGIPINIFLKKQELPLIIID